MQTLVFALLSMSCAAANDFVFKLYGRQRRPMGVYLAMIGIIWSLVFLVGRPFSNWLPNAATIQWGTISGIFSITANLLLVRAFTAMNTTRGGHLRQVDTPLVLFDEKASFIRLTAIAAGAAAVILFSCPKASCQTRHHFALRYVIAASFLRAGMGLTYKAGLSSGADECGILVINGIVWAVGGGLFCLVFENFTWRISWNTLKFGFISGILVCGIVGFLILALKQGDASLVLPVTQMSFALTAVFGIVLLNEQLTLNKFVCLFLAVVSVILFGIKYMSKRE